MNRNVDLEMNPSPPSIRPSISKSKLPIYPPESNETQPCPARKSRPQAKCQVSKIEEERKPNDPQFCQFPIPKKTAVSGWSCLIPVHPIVLLLNNQILQTPCYIFV